MESIASLMRIINRIINAYDVCDGTRGRFSCVDAHDLRCPKSKNLGGKTVCECGGTELEAAIAQARAASEVFRVSTEY